MAESFYIDPAIQDKKQKYEDLLPQLFALIEGEKDTIANLANTASALHHGMGFFWTGFYRVLQNELVLGPFQGPVACTRIQSGKGVCGKAWEEKQTILVPDVDLFPGHIACSSESRSEIVIPIIQNGKVIFILDVDSDKLNSFDETDKQYLEKIAAFLSETITADI